MDHEMGFQARYDLINGPLKVGFVDRRPVSSTSFTSP
jgi:hypothetical protein